MRQYLRLTAIASTAALLGSLAACGSPPMNTSMSSYPNTPVYPSSNYPVTTYPNANYPTANAPAAYVEYGRVTGIEAIRTDQQGHGSGAGAVIGGVLGGVLGNQIGGGTGRSVATVAGVVGGAVLGNSIEKNRATNQQETYRLSIQVDNGTMRSYGMATPGDLRIGDRVRIENGQIFRL